MGDFSRFWVCLIFIQKLGFLSYCSYHHHIQISCRNGNLPCDSSLGIYNPLFSVRRYCIYLFNAAMNLVFCIVLFSVDCNKTYHSFPTSCFKLTFWHCKNIKQLIHLKKVPSNYGKLQFIGHGFNMDESCPWLLQKMQWNLRKMQLQIPNIYHQKVSTPDEKLPYFLVWVTYHFHWTRHSSQPWTSSLRFLVFILDFLNPLP